MLMVSCCFVCILFEQSGRNALVLRQTHALQEKAVTIDSDNPAYLSELGYELLLQSRPRDAARCFNDALKMDESNIFTLTGLAFIRISEEKVCQADSFRIICQPTKVAVLIVRCASGPWVAPVSGL